MIGQHFDSIYIYINNITNKFNADNRLKIWNFKNKPSSDAIKDFECSGNVICTTAPIVHFSLPASQDINM